ncbi:MAG: hypothetical protein ABSB49_09870 [Polyangia bacterium]
MLQPRFLALALLAVACGPHDPYLPGSSPVTQSQSGGEGGKPSPSQSGGTSDNGGAAGTSPFAGASGSNSSAGGTSGNNPFGGNNNPFASGGGGGVGSSPYGTGGAGGVIGSQSGTGGVGATSTTYTWGVGSAPCASPKDLSCASAATGGGQTGNFNNTTEFCFRTEDQIAGLSCNNTSGWTMIVNGTPVTCSSGSISGGILPPALNGLYYFDFIGSASAVNYASLSWWGTCKAPPYPSWGGSTSASSDAGTTTNDGAP